MSNPISRLMMNKNEKELDRTIRILKKISKDRLGLRKRILPNWFWTQKTTLRDMKKAEKKLLDDIDALQVELQEYDGRFKSLKLTPRYNSLKSALMELANDIDSMLDEASPSLSKQSKDTQILQNITRKIDEEIDDIDSELQPLIKGRRRFLAVAGTVAIGAIVGGKLLISRFTSDINPHLKNIQIASYSSKEEAEEGIKHFAAKLNESNLSKLVPYMVINKHGKYHRIILRTFSPHNAAEIINRALNRNGINSIVIPNSLEFDQEDLSVLPIENRNFYQLIKRYLPAFSMEQIKHYNNNVIRPLVKDDTRYFLGVSIKHLKRFYLEDPKGYQLVEIKQGTYIEQFTDTIPTELILSYNGIDDPKAISEGCIIGLPTKSEVIAKIQLSNDPNMIKTRPDIYDQLSYSDNGIQIPIVKFHNYGHAYGLIERISRYMNIIRTIEEKHEIKPYILAAIAMQESFAGEKLLNSTNDGGVGICHIQGKTALEYGLKPFRKEYGSYDNYKQDGLDSKHIFITECASRTDKAQRYDERFHLIKNLDTAARIIKRGYLQKRSWDEGIMFFRAPKTKRNKHTRNSYLSKIKNHMAMIQDKNKVEKTKSAFNKVNPNISFDEYIGLYHQYNYNWDLQKYIDFNFRYG